MRRTVCFVVMVIASFTHAGTMTAFGQSSDDDASLRRQLAAEEREWYSVERDAFYYVVRATGHRRNCRYQLQQMDMGDEPGSPPDGLEANLRKGGFDIQSVGALEPDSNSVICTVLFGPLVSRNRMIVEIGADDYRGKSFDRLCLAVRVGTRWTFPLARVSNRLRRLVERLALRDCREYKYPHLDEPVFATRTSAVVCVDTGEPGPTDGHMRIIIVYERTHGRWRQIAFYEYESGV